MVALQGNISTNVCYSLYTPTESSCTTKALVDDVLRCYGAFKHGAFRRDDAENSSSGDLRLRNLAFSSQHLDSGRRVQECMWVLGGAQYRSFPIIDSIMSVLILRSVSWVCTFFLPLERCSLLMHDDTTLLTALIKEEWHLEAKLKRSWWPRSLSVLSLICGGLSCS